jgi:hypothetical protein
MEVEFSGSGLNQEVLLELEALRAIWSHELASIECHASLHGVDVEGDGVGEGLSAGAGQEHPPSDEGGHGDARHQQLVELSPPGVLIPLILRFRFPVATSSANLERETKGEGRGSEEGARQRGDDTQGGRVLALLVAVALDEGTRPLVHAALEIAATRELVDGSSARASLLRDVRRLLERNGAAWIPRPRSLGDLGEAVENVTEDPAVPGEKGMGGDDTPEEGGAWAMGGLHEVLVQVRDLVAGSFPCSTYPPLLPSSGIPK